MFKRITILVNIFIFLFSCTCLAVSPKVFFSDMTDAPIDGWDGSASKGAAVSIWGRNFGTTRGTSYVTVGGVNLTNSTDYAEWGATTNPTVPSGLQRITFWLNSSMSLGSTTISVTTSEGTSSTIAFYTRNTGNVYFVARDGLDTNTGLTLEAPFLTWSKVRETVAAGDAVYFRTGTWTEEDQHGAMLFLTGDQNTIIPYNSGTVNNSISFASYPGEVAQIGDGTTDLFMWRYKDYLGYWTFSKFKFDMANKIVRSQYDTCDDHIRWIGLEYTTASTGPGVGYAFNGYTDMIDYRIYGCYAYDCGDIINGEQYGSSMYFGGGQSQLLDVGWNEFTGSHRQIQFYGHRDTDYIDEVHFHDNFVHDNHRVSVMMGGGDPASGAEYSFVKKGYIYNNIIANNDSEMRIADGSKGTHGDFYIYNNFFYNNALGYGTREFWIVETDLCVFKNITSGCS